MILTDSITAAQSYTLPGDFLKKLGQFVHVYEATDSTEDCKQAKRSSVLGPAPSGNWCNIPYYIVA